MDPIKIYDAALKIYTTPLKAKRATIKFFESVFGKGEGVKAGEVIERFISHSTKT